MDLLLIQDYETQVDNCEVIRCIMSLHQESQNDKDNFSFLLAYDDDKR